MADHLLRRALATIALLAGTAALPATSAEAVQPTTNPCTTTADNIYYWHGGTTHDWGDGDNWRHGPGNLETGVPNDYDEDGVLYHEYDPVHGTDTANTIVCIVNKNDSVFIDGGSHRGDGYIWVQQIFVSGAFSITLHNNNTALLVMGRPDDVYSGKSVFGPATSLDIGGTFGGTGTLDVQSNAVLVHGLVSFPTHFSSQAIHPAGPWGPPSDYSGLAGTLILDTASVTTLSARGTGIDYGLDIRLKGSLTVTNDAYLAANDGTSFEVEPGGLLQFAAAGGYYQGVFNTNRSLSVLTNAGTIRKTGANTSSVVDAHYVLAAGGAVDVQSGTLALPDSGTAGRPAAPPAAQQLLGPGSIKATVEDGGAFGTGTCGPDPVDPDSSVCHPVEGSDDPTSVAVRAPTTGSGGTVSVRERPNVANLPYVGRSDVMATDIDGGAATVDDPDQVLLRYPASLMSGHLAGDIHVDRADDVAASPALSHVPDCTIAGQSLANGDPCIDRAASSTESGRYSQSVVVVLNIVNQDPSRWIVRFGTADVRAEGAIIGTPRVGATLDATGFSFTPAATVTGYQWNAGGTAVPGATSATYTPTPLQLGKVMSVTLTVTSPDFGTGSGTSPQTLPVAKGTLHGGPSTVDGVRKVGQTLTATSQGWGAATVSFQWTRNDLPVPGATGASYPLSVGDLGATVGLVTTGSADGYASESVPTSAGVISAGDLAPPGRPGITGRARRGKSLTAHAGTLPGGTTSVTYQWFRKGRPIAGRTGPKLRLKAGWKLGDAITVTVTAHADGYLPATSPPSAPVRIRKK